MNSPSTTALLCAMIAMACAACSKGPGDDPEPVADVSNPQGQDGNTESGVDSETPPAGAANQGLAGRIRLPNMENLPTERELASQGNADKNPGGGVIARPPSE